MNHAAWLLCLAAAATAVTAATAAGADDLARCAAIEASDARLACYDALAHRPADAAPSAVAVKPAAAAAAKPSAAAAAKPSAAAAAPVKPSPTAEKPPAAASATATSAEDLDNFGLSLAQQHMAFAGPTKMKARIKAINSGPDGQTYVVLDSGQSWIIAENDGWLSSGDAVTIKRVTLGAFLLVAPSNHTYHVRRVH